MVAFTSVTLTTTALLGLASAAPNTPPPAGVVHRAKAGFSFKLLFEPENVVAQPGDLVEVHFLPRNHSFVQSSFDWVGNHCQMGMAMFVNQDFSSNEKTLAKYKEYAKATGPLAVPPQVLDGVVGPNMGMA